MLQFWEKLFGSAQFFAEELDRLCPIVSSLLDSHLVSALSPVVSPRGNQANEHLQDLQWQGDNQKYSEKELVVMECKQAVCRILSSLLDQYYEAVFHNIMLQFKLMIQVNPGLRGCGTVQFCTCGTVGCGAFGGMFARRTVPTLSLRFFAPFLHRSERCYFASWSTPPSIASLRCRNGSRIRRNSPQSRPDPW